MIIKITDSIIKTVITPRAGPAPMRSFITPRALGKILLKKCAATHSNNPINIIVILNISLLKLTDNFHCSESTSAR
jgi:hypothetical protein